MPRRRRAAVLFAALALVSGCGTTVPLAQQRVASGASGLSDPAGSGAGDNLPTGSSTAATTGGTSGPAGPAGGVGSSTTTGGTGSTSTTGASSLQPPSGSAGAVPTSGPGWDATHVYVGIPTADDFDKTIKAAGGTGSNGDVHGDIAAVVAAINKAGGVLGRQVVAAYHDAPTTDYAYNPASTAQQMCTYFTQDRPVVAVINGVPQLDGAANFHTCLEKAKVSLLSLANTDYGDADYQRLGPHLWTTGSLSTDVLAPSLVAALSRQQFFTGWDVLNGKAGSAAVKVGALLPDTAQGRHVYALVDAALKRQGLGVASVFFYDPVGLGAKSQSEVLQFQSANVTHLLDLPPVAAEIWLFQAAAEQQQYRPRYGFTSFNLPLSVEENASIVPPKQQIGSMGIGWQPYNDTNAAHDPGPVPGAKRCLAALAQGGQTFGGGTRRGALIAVQLCDAFYLLADGLREGKGFTGSDLLAGMPLAGQQLTTAGTFGGGLTTTDHGLPGAYRDQHYDTGCSCFVYSGPTHALAR